MKRRNFDDLKSNEMQDKKTNKSYKYKEKRRKQC
jgi:hypothetical protein